MLGYFLRLCRRRIRVAAGDRTDEVGRASALVLAPHPDDETLGCGGVILRKLAAGASVTVVVVTDGRHSHRSAVMTAAEIATMRRAELAEAGRRLGLPGADLRQLGFADGALTGAEDALVDVITALVAEIQPAEVYVTGAFEPHPDHSALGRAARRAVARSDHPVVLLEYPIWFWHQLWDGGSAASWRVRLATAASAVALLSSHRRWVAVRTTGLLDAKLHALDAHVSQRGRPAGLPDSEPWQSLPPAVLSAAADGVELFLARQPPRGWR